MTAPHSTCQAGLGIVFVLFLLSLQGTAAQTNTTTTGVPGWGIALLVLTSLILAGILGSLCCVPLACKYLGQDSYRK